MEEIIFKYGPIAIMVVFIVLKSKLVVTPQQLKEALEHNEKKCEKKHEKQYVTKEEMQQERKDLFDEVERKFLSLQAFREYEKRMDENFKTINRRFSETNDRTNDRFDKVDNSFDKVYKNLEHITDLLIQRGD